MMAAQIKMVVSRLMMTGTDSGCTLRVEPQIGLWSVKEGESRKMPSFLV